MKKYFLSAAVLFLMISKTQACAWYDPDYEYFNLFTQSIIKDKTYLPFLHTLSNRFYGHEHFEIPDENIENWQKYFGNTLTYKETKTLVEQLPTGELNAFKNGNSNNLLLKKTGSYTDHAEGIDYLIEAKYLEPYMRINFVENPNSFYYTPDQADRNATDLDYRKTVAALKSLYAATQNPDIKLRYGYQLVRFNHYTRNYAEAVNAFKNYVEPLKIKSAPYFLALDQLAGAQRGLRQSDEANWNFFQVFMNSKSRKESAFVSMKLSDSATFDHLLERAETPKEKNMAYFLLGYDDYSDPIPVMKKMLEIDPTSEILKVLAARSVNELERHYLQIDVGAPAGDNSSVIKAKPSTQTKTKGERTLSFWQKLKNFFLKLFGSKESAAPEKDNLPSTEDLVNNPNRLPVYSKDESLSDEPVKNFLDEFQKITSEIKEKSPDEFWQITDAYLSFLQKDYKKSTETLTQIKTNNPEYIAEIDRMKMLNDIVSAPVITPEVENELLTKYPKIFESVFAKNDSETFYQDANEPSTQEFITDILANRYFLQGEEGKSFLMNNRLSDLQYNPNVKLVKSVEDFTTKPNKTALEEKIISKGVDDVGNIPAFFNVIYGDGEMRQANFEKAKSFYAQAKDFSGIPRTEYTWNGDGAPTVSKIAFGNAYNGFSHIPSLIFGHNAWESFQSAPDVSMKAENLSEFPFIKNEMNKLELSAALIELKKIAQGSGQKASRANQLIGNLLYNTSSLGYFREIFVMDINNEGGPKYHFYNYEEPQFNYYFKDFARSSFVEPDNFDVAISYYQKALDESEDHEQKARLLFQMASAEQGKYYQYEAKNPVQLRYDDPQYEEKSQAYDKKMAAVENEKYRTYFSELKKNYSQTQTAQALKGSCSYFDYFMKR
ncbi:hypothetical protein [Kaistella palustris]|uniref:hypothetical protein n=1 Tax=Kaistella palustris TaxID=493376 RepID=UPI0003FB945B|nr:hypothetical protein [Kaistella palustris]